MKKNRKSILDTDSNRESRHTRNTKSYQVLPKNAREVQTSGKQSSSPNSRHKKSKQFPSKLKKLVSPVRQKTSPSPRAISKYFKKKTPSTKSKALKETARLIKTPRSKKLLGKPSKALKSPSTITKPRKARKKLAKVPKHERSLPIFQVDLKERIKFLQERLERTKELLRPESSDKERAAIIIQRWFRSIKRRSKSESWDDVIQEELTTSDLLERFKKIVSQRSIDLKTIVPLKEELEYDDQDFVQVKYNRIPMLDLKNIRASFDSDDKAYEEVSYDESSINLEYNEISSIEASSDELSDIQESSASHQPSEHACESESPLFNVFHGEIPGFSGDETEPVPEFVFEDSLEFEYLDKEINFVLSKEISSFLKDSTFKIKEKEVDPSVEFVKKCVDLLMKFIRNNSLTYTEVMNSAIYIDPLEKLSVLQSTTIGELVETPCFEIIIDQSQLDALVKKFNPENIHTRNTYLDMVFDCFNEALNHARPYGLRGMPFPWSRRIVEVSEANPSFLDNTIALVEKWASLKCGKDQDLGIGLNKMVRLDVYSSEKAWANYEDEEAQVCFDISDLIAEFVVDEVIDILSH